MNAINRKIDPKADPATDPSMAGLIKKPNRIQAVLAGLTSDNPIAKPDRPHPPTEELRASLENVHTPQPVSSGAPIAPPSVPLAHPTNTIEEQVDALSATTRSLRETTATTPLQARAETAPMIETPVIETPQALPVAVEHATPVEVQAHSVTEPTPEPETAKSDQTWDKPVIQDEASISIPELKAAPRSRGRPRISEERKKESSFTLSPHVADRMRDLAAYNQLRLKRSVSASEIVEDLLMKAEAQIKDNIVLER